MKLSIIIPTFNRVEQLLYILQDLIDQDNSDFEVIVINDASNDDTVTQVGKIRHMYSYIKCIENIGKGQRDAKNLGISTAKGQYILFLEDDIRIPDINYVSKLLDSIGENVIIVSKLIMEDKCEINILTEPKKYSITPSPLIELCNGKNNQGSKVRNIFPFMETGTCFHKRLSSYFIDPNLVGDAYGESYSSGILLLNNSIELQFHPDLVVRHIGLNTGGSKKFKKMSMLDDFTPFHYGYFYNMIYLHARFKPWYMPIWIIFYFSKIVISLIKNRNIKGCLKYAISPTLLSFYRHFILRKFK